MEEQKVNQEIQEDQENPQQMEKVKSLSRQVLSLARDNILVHLRFFDSALANLALKEESNTRCMATDGARIYYDPVYILKEYQEEPQRVARCYLHMLLHNIFYHTFQYDKVEGELWDLAADIAVENTIIHMKIPSVTLKQDEEARRKLRVLREDTGALTAERLYRYFKNHGVTNYEKRELVRLFQKDQHYRWQPSEELFVTAQQLKKISERVRADIKSFTKAKSGADDLEKNLEEAARDRYDYGEILRRFTVMGEDITLNDDEFDYVYYTYGLRYYGNLPLVEPLEYREAPKVKEFVIAIDTSASCRGALVRAFLDKTYSILKGTENFFNKVNIHIVQCDSKVRSDLKITSQEEFEKAMKGIRLAGFGSTDFRPVFDYVEDLKDSGEFENLKGLIYFTDGYGVYPERMPDFDVIFAFLDEDELRAPVPPWSMKVILDVEELEGQR